MTDYLEDALRDHVLLHVPYTSPVTVYLALFTDATDDAGGGTEVVGGSYVRQAVTFDAGGAGTGAAENTDPVTFTNMPDADVVSAAIMDDPAAGNMLLHGPLAATKTVTAGDDLTFAAGDIDAVFA